MKYAEIRRAVLELIDQSTVAGEEVPLSYNNQADYVRKIPNLIDQAITRIRTTVLPDRRTAELTDGERRGGGVRYPLPADCRQLLSGSVACLDTRGRVMPTNRFRIAGRFITFQRPMDPEARHYVEYLAWPVHLPADAPDEYDLDETPDVIQAAEYYAAAMLVIREDEYLHANLMNEYETRLAAMQAPVTVEYTPVLDAFPSRF